MSLPTHEISTVLADVAGAEIAQAYRSALYIHHWLWQWLGVSDPGSLAYLRNVLFTYGLVEPSPEPAWIIDRDLVQYGRDLGPGLLGDLDRLAREALSGHVPPYEPRRTFDGGSGNGTAVYEMARPWVRAMGSGLSLLFGIDGTLRNWLVEQYRGAEVRGYRSESLASTLKLAEIYSVVRFVADPAVQTLADPFVALQPFADTVDSVIPTDVLERTSAVTEAELERLRSTGFDDRGLVAAIGLGYLLDALAGRVAVPNGMQFYYAWDDLSPDIIEPLREVLVTLAPSTPARDQLLDVWPEMEVVVQRLRQHLDDESVGADHDGDLRDSLPRLGDLLRQTGFELRARKADERIVSGLHAIGNAFWCWHFFLTDLARWTPEPSSPMTSYANRHIVRAWLERPWGVMRIDDMRIALDDSPDPSRPPPLMGPIRPLLRHGSEAFLREVFPGQAALEQRLNRLIAQRCILRDLRRSIRSVGYPESDETALADLLVTLLTSWFYSRDEDERTAIVEDGLTPLRDALITGDWLDAIASAPEMQHLSRRQSRLLARYRVAPVDLTRQLFEFDDDTWLPDRLDVYPVEEFWLWPR
jgi:hypothetical protein